MAAERSGGGKVPRRREATREQLLATAEACFIERGYHGSSVEWLAAQAGYTTGAIYSSFGDKAGLFQAVVDRRSEAQIEVWRQAAAAPDAESEVTAMLGRTLEDENLVRWFSTYYEYLAFALRNPALRPALSESYRRSREKIEEALEPLARRSTLPPDEFARLVLAAADGLVVITVATESTGRADLMKTLLSRLRDSEVVPR